MASNKKSGSPRPSSDNKPAGKNTRKPKKPVTIDLMATPVDGPAKNTARNKDRQGQSPENQEKPTSKQGIKSVPQVARSTDKSTSDAPSAEQNNEATKKSSSARLGTEDKQSQDKSGQAKKDELSPDVASSAGAPAAPQQGSAAGKLGAGVVGGVIALAGAWLLQNSGIWPAGSTHETDGSAQIARLEEQVNSKLVVLEENQTAAAIKNLATLETRLAELETAVTGASDQSDGATSALAESTEQLDELKTSFSKLDAKISNLENSVSSGNAGENTGLAALALRMDGLDTKISENSIPSVKDISPNIAELKGSLVIVEKTVSDAVGEIDGKIAAIEADTSTTVKEIAGLTQRIDALENLADAPGEDEQKVALTLALTGLKSRIDTGGGFEEALGLYESLSGDKEKTVALREFAKSGIPTSVSIAKAFSPVAEQIIKATAPKSDGSVAGRFFDSARSLVKVKTIGTVEGDGVDAVVSRIENAVENTDLAAAIEQWNTLPEAGKAASQSWIKTVKARHQADVMIGDLVKQFMVGIAETGN